MKKRFLTVFAALLLAVSLLSGCGRKEPVPLSVELSTPSATVDPHAGQVEVTDGSGGTMWVEDLEELSVFPMDRELFSVENGVAVYAGEDYILRRGVDVSDHQGEIDWQAVADSGVEFAIIRCGWRGYSVGGLNEDTWFHENVREAREAGLEVGAYFFSQAVSIAEAEEEALFTLEILGDERLDLPVFFDWEKISGDEARTDNVDGATVTDACLAYCDIIESEGYEAGVYSYLNLSYFTYDMERLAGLPLWMGDPGSAPEYYYDHDIWQYTFTASVPGIEGDVDMNVIYVPTAPVIENVSAAAAEEAAG